VKSLKMWSMEQSGKLKRSSLRCRYTYYTGHCLRRSSASLLTDAGADMHTFKRYGGWKSDNVAEGYVKTSVENKKIIATKICNGIFRYCGFNKQRHGGKT
jgi:integrase